MSRVFEADGKHEGWDEKFFKSLSLKNLSFNTLCKSQVSTSTLYQFVPQRNFQEEGNILNMIQSFKNSVFIVSNHKETFEEKYIEDGFIIVTHRYRPCLYNILKNLFGLTTNILDENYLLQIKHIQHPPFSISPFDSDSCICME